MPLPRRIFRRTPIHGGGMPSTYLHFGLARMLQTFCGMDGTTVGVFRTMAEAEEWLQLPVVAR